MKQDSNLVAAQARCEVRQPQPGDCDRIAELAGQLGYECTGEEVRERLCEMRDSNQYAVYVAELPGGLVAGWIGAYVFRSVETGSCAEISGLVIDERIRSSGIGKLLVSAVEGWARNVGCDAISVRSNVMRERARRFYTQNGYELVKTQNHGCPAKVSGGDSNPLKIIMITRGRSRNDLN